MEEPNNSIAEKAAYPKPTGDGFFYEDESNEVMGIESHVNPQTNREIRRVTLSTGDIALVRQLTGVEIGRDVARITGKNQEDYQFAMVAIATTIGDKALIMEQVKEMLGKDYIKLQVANSQLNF